MLSTSTIDSRKKEFSDHLEKLAELINEYHRVRFLTKDQRDQFIKSIERIKAASLEASGIGGEEKLKISELVAALEENQKSWTEELKELAKEPEIQRPTRKVEDGVEDDSREAYELFQEAMALYFQKLENESDILESGSSLRERWQNPINVKELDRLSYVISDDYRLRWLETYIGRNDPLVKHLRRMHDDQGSTAEDRRLVWCCANAAKEAVTRAAAKKTLMASAHVDVKLVAEVRKQANFNAAWKGVDKKLKKFNFTQKPGFFRRNIGKMLGMLAAVPFFLGAGMVIGTVAASFFGIIALPIALPVLVVAAAVSAGIGFLSIAAGSVGDFKKNRKAKKAREAMAPISMPEPTALSQQPIIDTKDSVPFLGAENPAVVVVGSGVDSAAAVLPPPVTDGVAERIHQDAQIDSGLSQTKSGHTGLDSRSSTSPVDLAPQIGQGITSVFLPNRENSLQPSEAESGSLGQPADPFVPSVASLPTGQIEDVHLKDGRGVQSNGSSPLMPLGRAGSPSLSETNSELLTQQDSDASGSLPPTAVSPGRRYSLPDSGGSPRQIAAALQTAFYKRVIPKPGERSTQSKPKGPIVPTLFAKPPTGDGKPVDEAASPTPSQQSSPRGPTATSVAVLAG